MAAASHPLHLPLFLNPFDEKFVEDALERVEIEIGFTAADMRTRGTIAQSILTNFSRELQGRSGFHAARPFNSPTSSRNAC